MYAHRPQEPVNISMMQMNGSSARSPLKANQDLNSTLNYNKINVDRFQQIKDQIFVEVGVSKPQSAHSRGTNNKNNQR